jgi:hypothetical protein
VTLGASTFDAFSVNVEARSIRNDHYRFKADAFSLNDPAKSSSFDSQNVNRPENRLSGPDFRPVSEANRYESAGCDGGDDVRDGG